MMSDIATIAKETFIGGVVYGISFTISIAILFLLAEGIDLLLGTNLVEGIGFFAITVVATIITWIIGDGFLDYENMNVVGVFIIGLSTFFALLFSILSLLSLIGF